MNREPEQTLKELFDRFNALYNEIRALSPIGDDYLSLSITHSGFNDKPPTKSLHVFYGPGLVFDVLTFSELRQKVNAYDPVIAKANRIKTLEAELAELKGQQ